jgi:hypothetical protein
MMSNDNTDPKISAETALAEVLELIRLMLADSPYPVSAEDFPRVAAPQAAVSKRRRA